MFKGQALHSLLLAAILAGVSISLDEGLLAGRFAGLRTSQWLFLALTVPIVHQIYVWLVWRSELHYEWISRRLGKRRGFRVYAIGFAILLVSRLLSIIPLAIANQNSSSLHPAIALTLAGAFLPLGLYLFYSVYRYFGFARAMGIDHFDASYRNVPFVREGIFRISANGMYTFGFLVLWIPGLLLNSKAALLAGLFNHVYIWVHYYCTELPDIHVIYGGKDRGA